MKAMIFAAGLGTRLRPLTDNKPKALVEIQSEPMLKHAVKKLKNAGVTDLVVNVHHFSEQIVKYLSENNNFGLNVSISDESASLMNTGGGLKKASAFLKGDEPFIVMNVDVISNIDLSDMYQKHINSGALATLAVKKRDTSRYLLFDNKAKLCGWKNKKTGELKEVEKCDDHSEMAFSGIQVISPRIFDYMDGFDGAFSIIDLYLEIAKNEKISAYDHSAGKWMDLGKYDEIGLANQLLETIDKEN